LEAIAEFENSRKENPRNNTKKPNGKSLFFISLVLVI